MPLSRPVPLRLSAEQLTWLDLWRGTHMSRSTAIRLIIQKELERSQTSHEPQDK